MPGRFAFAGLILAIGATAAFSQEPVAKPTSEILDFKASLERALSNNPRLLAAKKDFSIAQTQVRQARSQFYPKVNLNLNYIRFRNETLGITPDDLGNAVLEAPIPSANGVRSNPLAENLYLGRVGFQQTLYAGGKLRYTYKLSKANVRRLESLYETLKHEVEYDTAKAYLELVALKEKERLIKDNIFELEKVVKLANTAHAGLLVSSIRSRLQKELGDMKLRQTNVRFDYLQAMGVELFSDVDVAGSLNPQPFDESSEALLVRAKENRVELKETQIQEEVDQLSIDLSSAERYPVFLLGGGVEVRDDRFPLEQANWNTVLSMNIPIFDGFSSLARIRESRYRADQSRLNRVRVEDQIEREVRSAYNAFQHWEEQWDSRQMELDSLNASKNQYFGSGQSRSSIQDRVDFLQWRLNASLGVVEAKYETALAIARLSRATGRSLIEQ